MANDLEQMREEARRKILEKIKALEAELGEYQADFVSLQNAEESLTELYTSCDLISSAVSSVGFTLNEICDLGTSDRVPGYEQLFTNFGQEVSSDVAEVNVANNNCISEIETTGSQVDAAQTEVAANIKRLTQEINLYKESLAFI